MFSSKCSPSVVDEAVKEESWTPADVDGAAAASAAAGFDAAAAPAVCCPIGDVTAPSLDMEVALCVRRSDMSRLPFLLGECFNAAIEIKKALSKQCPRPLCRSKTSTHFRAHMTSSVSEYILPTLTVNRERGQLLCVSTLILTTSKISCWFVLKGKAKTCTDNISYRSISGGYRSPIHG